MDGEMKQNVLGRCPEGKMQYTRFCEIRFGAIYALLSGEIFCKKLGRWRKNDKYQVCTKEVDTITKLP